MAQTESKIKLIFDGTAKGVVAAAKQAQAAIKGLDDDNSRLNKSAGAAEKALGGMVGGMFKLGAAGGAVQTIGGVVGALTQLAPAALLLPGALLGGAAAMGTFKLATAGFGEAIGAGLSGDMKAFAEATKDMDPAMRSAAQAVTAFKPQIDALRKTVQNEFWQDFSGEITDIGNTYMPIMEKGLVRISGGLSKVAFGAAEAVKTPFFTDSVTSIIDSTADALDNMQDSVGNVLKGFVGLGGIGATYLPRLTAQIERGAKAFGDWVQRGSEQGTFIKWINGAIAGFKDLWGIVKNVGSILGSVFRGLGADMSSPLANLRELTGQVAEFLKTTEAQDGLKALGETLKVVGEVVGKVVMTALKELAPTLVELAPVAQEVARTLGDLLVSALETLGPLIRDIAHWFGEHPAAIDAATVAVVGFVAAIKTIKVASEVKGWLDSALGAIRGFGGPAAKAAEESGKGASIAWGKGFTGGLALVGVGVGGTILLDKFLPADAAKTHGSQVARDMLHEMATVFQGGGTAFQPLDVAQWISNPISMAVELGKRQLMSLFGVANSKIPPITFDANLGPAQGQVASFMNQVKGTSGTVEINGRTEDAAQALADIVQAINQGQGTVTVNGQNVPAQDALRTVIDQINNGAGTVTVNGQTVPAGQALASLLGRVNGSSATIGVGANTGGANASVSNFVSHWNGYTIRMNAVVSSRIGGLAGGGPVAGPGTGTSDTAGLYALSNGEYVATAKQVDNAGGPEAFGRLMASLDRGQIPHLAAGGSASPMHATAKAAMRTPAPASSSSSGDRIQLVAGPGADSATAAFIAGLVRTGKLQLKAA